MNSPEEPAFRSEKVAKRGAAAGKDSSCSPGNGLSSVSAAAASSPEPGGLFSISISARGKGQQESRSARPKGAVLGTIGLVAVLALSCSAVLVNSFWRSAEFGAGAEAAATNRLYGGRPRPTEWEATAGAWTAEEFWSRADRGVTCDPKFAALRVFVYDMPPEFHFGMMADFDAGEGGGVWPRNLSDLPRYPGGLYQQHSPEYWLTADLITSNSADRRHECTAVRVDDPREADVVFVPFFASLSYNKYSKVERARGERNMDEELQERLVSFLAEQRPWQETGGRDHVIVIHHPNSLHWVRDRLNSAMYVVCDFGRYETEVANVEKDIVAPYKHVIPSFVDDRGDFEARTTLLFFQGAIVRKEGGVIRQKLNELLKEEEGVKFVTGNTQSNGIRSATLGMRNAKFCLHLAGDTPSSNRLFDAVASRCVPVVVSDEIELPFEDALDYADFCVFVRAADALKPGFLIRLLRGVQEHEWTAMWRRLRDVAAHFEYQHPAEPADAVSMVWKAIARRAPAVRLAINKGRRYARSGWPQPLPRPAGSAVE